MSEKHSFSEIIHATPGAARSKREQRTALEPQGQPAGPGQQPQATGKSKSKFRLIKQSINRFIDDDCTTMAAALAYYTTFSLAPLLLVVISVAGLVFGRQAVQQDIQNQIQGLIGQGAAGQVGTIVQNAGEHSSTGILGAILGVLAVLVGASGAFTQLQSSLNVIWRVKPDPNKSGIKEFLTHRILSFGMILAIAFLLIVSLAVSAALSAFGTFVSAYLPHGFSGALLQVIGFVVSLVIIALLFAAMYKILPDARIDWRDVWFGAGLTAVLFTVGKTLIGLYLGHSGMASAYGAAGSFVLVVLWIYYSSIVFLYGAEFTALWSEAHSGPIQPTTGAVKDQSLPARSEPGKRP